MKCKEWLEKWLKNYVEPTAKQRTYEKYSQIVNLHISPKFGDMDITDFTPFVLQNYVTELISKENVITGKEISSSTINSIITVIQSSLKTAYMLNYISSYGADKVKRPKINERKVKCFSINEQKKMESYILQKQNTKLLGIVLCLYTGLRIGELLALEWSDIDFKKEELNISKTCYEGKDKDGVYKRITNKPKTNSSNRTIPLPKQIVSLLKQAKKKAKSKYVISNGENYISVRSYQRTFKLLLNKLNIAHKGFHSLRHTFATRALECGMDVKTLSEILGHKSPIVTLNCYAHSRMEHKKAMMNKLGKLL